MKFIPITNSILTESNYHGYYFSSYIRFNTTTQYCSISKENKTIVVLTHIGEDAAPNTYHRLGVSRQAGRAAGGNSFPTVGKIIDEPVSMMPYATYDLVMTNINALPMKSRNPLGRLFCYVYYNDAYYNGEWQQPQEQMAIELKMSLPSVNRGLKQLIAGGVIERSGHYKFTGEDTFAYRHTIPNFLKCGDIFHDDVKYPHEY